jgi:sialate O-acetylesterase
VAAIKGSPMSHRALIRFRILACLVLSLAVCLCVSKREAQAAREREAALIVPATIFRSNMVLQRDKALPVWGTALPGKTLCVSFSGQRKYVTVARDGAWKVELEPLALNSEGRNLTIAYDPSLKAAGAAVGPVALRNVLVGDVWLCAGQSNMEFGCDMMTNSDAELAGVDFDKIRLFLVEKSASIYPQKKLSSEGWRPATERNLRSGGWGGFSAVAFAFARKVYRETGVPLGLIQSAYGSTKISAWMPRADIDESPAFQADRGVLESVEAQYREALKRNPKAANPYAAITEKSDILPSTCFNSMVSPFVPLALKGVLWYQGETDMGSGRHYAEEMRAHIASWRRIFLDESLPYYYVALPPFEYGRSEQLPEFNEAQASCLDIPRTGMATIIDLGDFADIHPRRKVEVGERLARLALHDLYGQTSLETSGPQPGGIQREGGAVRVSFSHCAGGLVSKSPEAVPGFELAGSDGVFRPAEARIEGESLVVSSASVPRPLRLRYAWTTNPTVDLYNKAGLPALAFRGKAKPASRATDFKHR